METQVIYQMSLIAAFIAGVIALFAPCCISYLLPSYLANIFKEKRKVLFMTFIYSLGIFVVMLPVVLGARALSSFFFRIHDQTYIIGGVVLMIIGVLALLGWKLPMINIKQSGGKKRSDVVSTFTLGVISGITSACCAPVLLGVLTLSSLSASTAQAFSIAVVYVIGMVTPLYLAALFINKRNILAKPILKKELGKLKVLGKEYTVLFSNALSSAIFFFTGLIMLVLVLSGNLSVDADGGGFTKTINSVTSNITEFTRSIPGINVIFIVLLIFAIYRIAKLTIKKD